MTIKARQFINNAKIGSFVDEKGRMQSAEYLDELSRKLAEWAMEARGAAADAWRYRAAIEETT